MKQCKCCGTKVNDTSMYCHSCGATSFALEDGNNTYDYAYTNMQQNSHTQYNANIQQNFNMQSSYDMHQNNYYTNNYNTNNYNKASKRKECIPLGVIGALLGFIIVAFAWILLGKIGIYVRIQGIFFVYIPCAMYTAFSHKPKLIATVIICSMALLLLYPLERFNNICNVQDEYAEEYNKEVNYKEASELYDYHFNNQIDYKLSILFKFVISYVCAILCTYSYVVYTVKKEGNEDGSTITNDAAIY